MASTDYMVDGSIGGYNLRDDVIIQSITPTDISMSLRMTLTDYDKSSDKLLIFTHGPKTDEQDKLNIEEIIRKSEVFSEISRDMMSGAIEYCLTVESIIHSSLQDMFPVSFDVFGGLNKIANNRSISGESETRKGVCFSVLELKKNNQVELIIKLKLDPHHVSDYMFSHEEIISTENAHCSIKNGFSRRYFNFSCNISYHYPTTLHEGNFELVGVHDKKMNGLTKISSIQQRDGMDAIKTFVSISGGQMVECLVDFYPYPDEFEWDVSPGNSSYYIIHVYSTSGRSRGCQGITTFPVLSRIFSPLLLHFQNFRLIAAFKKLEKGQEFKSSNVSWFLETQNTITMNSCGAFTVTCRPQTATAKIHPWRGVIRVYQKVVDVQMQHSVVKIREEFVCLYKSFPPPILYRWIVKGADVDRNEWSKVDSLLLNRAGHFNLTVIVYNQIDGRTYNSSWSGPVEVYSADINITIFPTEVKEKELVTCSCISYSPITKTKIMIDNKRITSDPSRYELESNSSSIVRFKKEGTYNLTCECSNYQGRNLVKLTEVIRVTPQGKMDRQQQSEYLTIVISVLVFVLVAMLISLLIFIYYNRLKKNAQLKYIHNLAKHFTGKVKKIDYRSTSAEPTYSYDSVDDDQYNSDGSAGRNAHEVASADSEERTKDDEDDEDDDYNDVSKQAKTFNKVVTSLDQGEAYLPICSTFLWVEAGICKESQFFQLLIIFGNVDFIF
ncbi:hypothetical protein HELRODRAFT_182976 [Helobdella robusta]|uniref:Uncharacterized protein n=1 Tax=Helobdella robusta TaxID=6412 RepID=T1FJ11_HELRO|nr:hypothetical protein HELRODRAFT_182976 [Helobdella robusta]ESN89967.1 hypothetical protein HELRODRAFT_182976 [Helobdella robusta]